MGDGKVLKLHESNNEDDARRILESCIEEKPTRVIVLYEANGEYRTYTNIDDGGTILWLLEFAKLRVTKTLIRDVFS